MHPVARPPCSSPRKGLGRLGPSLLTLTIAVVSGCGGGGGRRANLTPGVMPSGETFTGVYQSPQYGEMHVLQTGAQVVGEYTHDERRGRLQGTVQGDLLRFEWTERRELVVGRPNITRGRGYFRFVAGEDGSYYLVGEWGHDDNETGGGPWRAVRLRNRRPRLSTDGGSRGGDTGEPQGDDLDSPSGYGSSGYDSGGSSGQGGSSGRGGSRSRGSDDLSDL